MYEIDCPFCGKPTDDVEVCRTCNDRLLKDQCVLCGSPIVGADECWCLCNSCRVPEPDLYACRHCHRQYGHADEADRCPCGD